MGKPQIDSAYALELWRLALEWAHQVYWREETGETDPTGGALWFFHAREEP